MEQPVLVFSAEEEVMTRDNWQALVFGLILLALCFVQ
jgi:hypothetical protein